MKRLSILLLLGAVLASGCARTRAKAMPDNPPLDMPPPPAHDVESSDENPPEPVGLPSEPARTTTIRPRQPPPPMRTEAPRAEPKPEAPPPEPPKPSASEEPARSAPTLQTAPAEAEAELEKSVRTVMARAQHDLNRIDYRSLNQEARDQYEYAKSFIRQADDAIRVKNLPFAKTVADKAAVLAAQLAGRR
jgi:outer membrane biosynthesis protein TonB